MKYLKLFSVIVCISALWSCTKKFEALNTDETKLSPLDPNVSLKGAIATSMQWALPYSENAWQLAVELTGSSWIGYTGTPTPFGGNNNTNYTLRDDWNWAPWTDTYKIMPFVNSLKEAYNNKNPNPNIKAMYALSLIIKVFAMQRVTDSYGPIIYANFGTEKSSDYESQSSVYKQFFADLDEAIEVLKIAKSEKLDFKSMDNSLYAGDADKWIAFASSLRLRVAMRMVKADPTLAKQEAEKAIAEGVITDNSSNAVVANPNLSVLGLYIISDNWNDSRMGAVMYSLLEGYKDPREQQYFKPVGNADLVRKAEVKPYSGRFLAIRGGIAIGVKEDRTDFSSLGEAIGKTNKMVWMTAAETFFLRAEGALRGWAMNGDSKSLYESGIRASFGQYGLAGVDKYIADGTSVAAPYTDPVATTGENNIPAGSPHLSTITIAWNDADSNERKLERIITQKYLAMFPNGADAWAEWRRTGYPKVFPVVVNTSGGVISTEEGVRRLNFSIKERQSSNAPSVDAAVQLLKTESSDFRGDNGATRVWWDVKGKGNF